MSIKGLWRLNGNSNDASGNGSNGADTNITYAQSNGVLNGGASFNGTDSKVFVPTSAGINGTGSYTLRCLVKLSALPALNGSMFFIIKGYETTSFASSFWIRAENLSNVTKIKAEVVTTTPSTTMYSVNGLTPETNKWYYCVAIFNSSMSKLSLYVNGIKQGDDVTTGTNLRNYATGLALGSMGTYYPAYGFHNGAIDEALIDNSAWSVAMAKNDYAKFKGFF